MHYAECGSRYHYPTNDKLFDSRESIATFLVSKLFNYIFDEFSSKRIPDVVKLNKQLNILWDKIKKKITFNISTNDFVIFQSFGKRLLTHLHTFDKLEVISNNQIFDYLVGEDIIKIPLTVFRSVTSIYVYYIDSDCFIQDKPIGYSFLQPIVTRLTKEICKGHTYKHFPTIYRSQVLRTYQCIDDKNVDLALNHVIKGIKHEVFIPRVSLNCKLCKSKETCDWYSESN